MRCYLCDDNFYIKRGITDLFSSKKEYICNKCYKKYPINLSYEVIQLEKYNCIVLSIFNKKYNISYEPFYKEISTIFTSNLKKGYKTFLFEHIELSDYNLEILDGITKLAESNIIVICLSCRL